MKLLILNTKNSDKQLLLLIYFKKLNEGLFAIIHFLCPCIELRSFRCTYLHILKYLFRLMPLVSENPFWTQWTFN